MKRIILYFLLCLIIMCSSACSSFGSVNYKDGTYYAEQEGFPDSSWKNTVSIEVLDGKITKVNWNGLSEFGGEDRKTNSLNGNYGLKKVSSINKDWHEQASVAEDLLITLQTPSKMKTKDGVLDDVAGCTIKVSEFVKLAEIALEEAK